VTRKFAGQKVPGALRANLHDDFDDVTEALSTAWCEACGVEPLRGIASVLGLTRWQSMSRLCCAHYRHSSH
jgi:hypothetical protein